MADWERAGGFWQNFANNAGGAFDQYNQMKAEKQKRAQQKLKFITENADVGSPVDTSTQQDINDYASEGSGLIQDGQYVGSPEQQRTAEFRKYVEQNPDADPEAIMTRGAASGAVPAGTYGSFLSGQEARAQRMIELQQRLLQQKELQEDRQSHSRDMKGIAQAIASRGGGYDQGDGNEFYGTKANIQKLVANRKSYNNDPYGHLINKVFNDPASAAIALSPNDQPVDINSAEPWDNFIATIDGDPEVRQNLMTDYGLRAQELEALKRHMKRIADKRRGG
jgi:NADH dehydrogenase/NADH:ubiquinone oxidoreductase subunit G